MISKNLKIVTLFFLLTFFNLSKLYGGNIPFVMTWEVNNEVNSLGIMMNNTVSIPVEAVGYDYTVDWGDGQVTMHTGNATHTYSLAQVYTISITGDFPRILFNESSSRDRLLTIEQWGDNVWSSMERAFAGCVNLKGNFKDVPNLTNVTNMSNMFANTAFFNSDIGNWDVSNVTDMSNMFANTDLFNGDIANWDVSNVENMQEMFSHAFEFNQDIGNWDVGNVIDMSSMFFQAKKFNQDIGRWDVRSVTNMGLMFSRASLFNQDLGFWQVINVTNMRQIFLGADLSTKNYDALLIGWSNLNLKSKVIFGAGESRYCYGKDAKEDILLSFDWEITDGGTAAPVIYNIEDKKVSESYTFPDFTGENLSGNEKYYTLTNGMGTIYTPGDIINFDDYPFYPLLLYIYDNNSICSIEEKFELTIFPIPACTVLKTPSIGENNVKVSTDLAWEAIEAAEGYRLSVGTGIDRSDILDNIDVGDVLTYSLFNDLPEKKEIFVTIIPYNAVGDTSLYCAGTSFFTETLPRPPAFFTPNNDGVHDTWIVPDPDNKILNVFIYDRYGKLIKQFSNIDLGWDGTYLNKLLPANDYWYKIKYKNGDVLNGHLCLVR